MGKTLVEHAAYELTKAGLTNHEDPEARKAATDTIALVRRFEKQGHNTKTAPIVLDMFQTICNFLPLTPITDDPEEWEKFEIDKRNVDTNEVEKKTIWNSRRATSIFSEDEGKTWYDQATGNTGESLDHVKEAEKKEAEAKAREERKKAAEQRAKGNPVGHMNPGTGSDPSAATPETATEAENPEVKPTAGTATEANEKAKAEKPAKKNSK